MSTMEELVAARDLAERAMNYVERCGFAISVYSQKHECNLPPEGGDDCEYYGMGCYIGTFRIAAGVAPDPADEDGSVNDGAQLRVALEAADAVALEAIRSRGLEEQVREQWTGGDLGREAWVESEPLGEGVPPGRLVEALGFADERLLVETRRDSQEAALGTLRNVLTRLNSETQEREAVPA